MTRIQFKKSKQKAFLNLVIKKLDSPSLRSLLQFGLKTNYSSLKNYYTERRTLPYELFNDLCILAKISPQEIPHLITKKNWGQIKGGKISKRRKK